MKHMSVMDGLQDLHERMSADVLQWPEAFSTAYAFNKEASTLLTKKANADAPVHSLWNDAYMSVSMMDNFTALFWMKTFHHLGDVYDVPMSWVAALKMFAHPDAIGDKWGLKPIPSFIDSEGYCYESLWAAHTDGLTVGLIEIEDFVYERKPEAVAFSKMALEAATHHAELQDMEVEDFLDSIMDDTLDMTLPIRGDDE